MGDDSFGKADSDRPHNINNPQNSILKRFYEQQVEQARLDQRQTQDAHNLAIAAKRLRKLYYETVRGVQSGTISRNWATLQRLANTCPYFHNNSTYKFEPLTMAQDLSYYIAIAICQQDHKSGLLERHWYAFTPGHHFFDYIAEPKRKGLSRKGIRSLRSLSAFWKLDLLKGDACADRKGRFIQNRAEQDPIFHQAVLLAHNLLVCHNIPANNHARGWFMDFAHAPRTLPKTPRKKPILTHRNVAICCFLDDMTNLSFAVQQDPASENTDTAADAAVLPVSLYFPKVRLEASSIVDIWKNRPK